MDKKVTKSDKTKMLEKAIAIWEIDEGYNKKDLAAKLCMATSTFYKHLEDIHSFRLDDLVMLCEILKMDDASKLKLLSKE